MFSGTKYLFSAAMALQSMGHVFGQCVTTSNVNWYSCGPSYFYACDDALLSFAIRWDANCVASNPIVTVDFAGPITIEGTVYGETGFGGSGWISGDVSDDLATVIFDTSVSGLDSHDNEAGISYFRFVVDNCDTAFTWSDNFFQLSYVDDELNTIDMSGVENPDDIFGPDNGACDDEGADTSFSFSFNLNWDDDDFSDTSHTW